MSVPLLVPLICELLWVAACVYWFRTTAAERRTRFIFYITDIWALILGLTPTFIMLHFLFGVPDDPNSPPSPMWQRLLLLAMTLSAQLGGMFFGYMYTNPRYVRGVPGRSHQAVRIVLGALIGIAAKLALLFVAALMLFLLMIAIAVPPINLVLLYFAVLKILAWLLKKKKSWRRPDQ